MPYPVADMISDDEPVPEPPGPDMIVAERCEIEIRAFMSNYVHIAGAYVSKRSRARVPKAIQNRSLGALHISSGL